MVFDWIRCPEADAAETATVDTTETKIAGIDIPSWGKSIKWLEYALTYAALTSQEECAGYLRVKDESNQIEPFYLPLPVAGSLATAAGTHLTQTIRVPVELPVVSEDTVNFYVALDSATTGAPTISIHALITDQAPKYREHSVVTDLQTADTTAATKAAGGILETLSKKCSSVHQISGYVSIGAGDTAAQTQGGYIVIESAVLGWLTQRLKTNTIPAGLGADIDGYTKPFIYAGLDKLPFIDGFEKSFWPGFSVKGRNKFTLTSYMNDTNTVAPTWRLFLGFKE